MAHSTTQDFARYKAKVWDATAERFGVTIQQGIEICKEHNELIAWQYVHELSVQSCVNAIADASPSDDIDTEED